MSSNAGLSRIKNNLGKSQFGRKGVGSFYDMFSQVRHNGSDYKLRQLTVDIDEEGNAEAAFQFRTHSGEDHFFPYKIGKGSRKSSFKHLSDAASKLGVPISSKQLLGLKAGRYDVMSENVEDEEYVGEQIGGQNFITVDFDSSADLSTAMSVLRNSFLKYAPDGSKTRPYALILRNVTKSSWLKLLARFERMGIGYTQSLSRLRKRFDLSQSTPYEGDDVMDSRQHIRPSARLRHSLKESFRADDEFFDPMDEEAGDYSLAVVDFQSASDMSMGLSVLRDMNLRFTPSSDRRRPNAIILRNVARSMWRTLVSRLAKAGLRFSQDVVDLRQGRDPGYSKTDWDNQARAKTYRPKGDRSSKYR